MKPWIKRSLAGVFGASVLFGGLAACSHRGPDAMGGFGMGGGHAAMSEADQTQMRARMVERVASRLSLDAAQRGKLETLAKTMQEQRQAFVSAGAAAGSTDPRAELKSVLAGTTFDRSKATALVQAKTSAVQSGSPALIAAMADFYDSLKPEQQQQVRDFLDRGGRGGHRGRH